MRLLPNLVRDGHEVICVVRSKNRLSVDADVLEQIQVVEFGFLQPFREGIFPQNIDAAYYLIHSMSASTQNFDELEAQAARTFNRCMADAGVKQVIYLSGIVNEDELSKHLRSRKQVENILYEGNYHLTVLRAGIIVGSGSSSFEIIRDLCEKLPVMITPKWVLTKTQPIAIRDVIKFLTGVLGREEVYDQSFDIGGPDVLTYKEMLKRYAKVRGFKNYIFTVPVMTPKLSSYWLYFVTSTSYKLAVNLVDSMKMEVIARDNRLQEILGIETHTYEEAIKMAFDKIEQNLVISSWKDSLVSGRIKEDLKKYIQVPKYGVLKDHQAQPVSDKEAVIRNIWKIGGQEGWYYASWLWRLRGLMDKLFGGVGLRRGRTHLDKISPGDALDFWRVLLADKQEGRLLLLAEMRLPGEAWLEFRVDESNTLHQTATFRPRGLKGRLYWYALLPFHFFIFNGMIRRITKTQAKT